MNFDNLQCDCCHPTYLYIKEIADRIVSEVSPQNQSASINHKQVDLSWFDSASDEKVKLPTAINSNPSRWTELQISREKWSRNCKRKTLALSNPVPGVIIRLSLQSVVDSVRDVVLIQQGDLGEDIDSKAELLSGDFWREKLNMHLLSTGVIINNQTEPNLKTAEDRSSSLTFLMASPACTKTIATWIQSCYPRPVNRTRSCWKAHSLVKIGAVNVPDGANGASLIQYRKFLLAKFLAMGLGKAGCIINAKEYLALPDDKELENKLFVVSEDIKHKKSAVRISIGRCDVHHAVVADDRTYKDMTAEQFHNLRKQILESSSETGHFQPLTAVDDAVIDWSISAANLATLTMNYEMLRKNPNCDLNLNSTVVGNQIAQEALLIMYNYTRVVSILKKFKESVIKGDYPELPCLEMTDFSSLQSKEELDLVSLLWEWPGVLDGLVDFEYLEVNAASVLKCMKALANRINSFYTAHIVLVPTIAPHNFGTMFARIHLLDACRKVMEEFFDILQVEVGDLN